MEISPKRSSEEKKRKGKEREEGKTGERKRKRERSLGRMGRWFLLIVMIGQSLGGINAASENVQNREKKITVSQGESETMESSWVQVNDKRNFQKEKEMQK